MSGHTQGRLVVLNSFLVPVAHADRKLGGSSDPKHDHDEYAHYIADVKGKRDYHNHEANARRLAAAWNVCENIDTESLETGATLAEICERSNGYVSELNAARALLREVQLNGVWCSDAGENYDEALELEARIGSYLEACDTLEGNKPVDAAGCRKCGDILPAGSYCKAPACPLNPSMKGE